MMQLLTRMDKMHSDLVRKALDALSSLAERGDRYVCGVTHSCVT